MRDAIGQLRPGLVLAPLLPFTLALAACGSPAPIVAGVQVSPSAISPNGDGQADVASIRYTVGQPALVTIALRDADGREHLLRDRQPREPGSYEALFGGVVDGRMLANGAYEVVVRGAGRPGGNPVGEARARLDLAEADEAPPTLEGFTVDRSTFSPNQDGIGDAVRISFTVTEPLADFRLRLETADGQVVTDILQERETADDPTQPGAHDFRFDAGVDADAPPPPPGDYRIVAEARDAVGNVTRLERPLAIRDSGKPSVTLTGDVTWSDTVLPLGDTLWFTATVRNVGDSPIRTRGPEPGFVYGNAASYNQVAAPELLLLARWGEEAVSRRLPADQGDLEGILLDLAAPEAGRAGDHGGPGPGADGSPPPPTPTAGGLPGADEGPGSVSACGRVTRGGAAVAGAEVYLFEADGDNGRLARSAADGGFCFEAVRVPPPLERNYAQSSGAMRLGVKYDDARQTLDYPYRWQLGRTAELDVCDTEDRLYLCLAPGRQVQVSGGIRFDEPPLRRDTAIYTALLHEDVRVIQPGYGRAKLTIEHD